MFLEGGKEWSSSTPWQEAHRAGSNGMRSSRGKTRGKIRVVKLELEAGSTRFRPVIEKIVREFGWVTSDETAAGTNAIAGVIRVGAGDIGTSCPVVKLLGLDASVEEPSGCVATVSPDPGPCGELAAGHLLSLGFGNIALFHRGSAADTPFCKSFLESCRSAGKEPVVLPSDPSDAGASVRAHLAGLETPCAIMADDDLLAAEIISTALTMGMRVPGDVAVLGTGGLSIPDHVAIHPLTVIDLNLERIGYAAALLLDRAMRGEPVLPARSLVPPKGIVERGSTATYACENPGISRAIVKIRTQYRRPLRVALLARECGMSVRNLYRQYRQVTGNTIGQDILARRMEAAANLLRDERLKLHVIAVETGLGNARNLCRLFKDYYGQTPGQWRAATKVAAPPA